MLRPFYLLTSLICIFITKKRFVTISIHEWSIVFSLALLRDIEMNYSKFYLLFVHGLIGKFGD